MTAPIDFERARFNMIEQQIRPWDVLDLDVLALLSTVKREDFVPLAHKALAFVDMQLPLLGDTEDALARGGVHGRCRGLAVAARRIRSCTGRTDRNVSASARSSLCGSH